MSNTAHLFNRRTNSRSWLVQAAEKLYVWQQRAAARRQLLQLDDRLLKDIGLSRTRAETEGAKPFWQP